MLLKLQALGGMIPVSGDRALPDGFGVESVNTWLYGQELIGNKLPINIINGGVNSTARKLLRIPPNTIPPWDIMNVANVWKMFDDPDTDFAFAPTAKDSHHRVYWASPSTGPRFAPYSDLEAGTNPSGYRLGMPGPDTTLVEPDKTNDWKPTIQKITPRTTGKWWYEIEFKIGTAAGSTAYTNAGGSGDRLAVINLASTINGNGAWSKIVNGNLTEQAVQMTNMDAADKWIRFDFGATKFISEIRWYQEDDTDYGSWSWQGSADASAWVNLANIYLGGAKDQKYTVNEGVGYRYFRLVQATSPSAIMVTRAYLYTWVNQFGEESAPSLPTTGAGSQNGVWEIGNIRDPSPNPKPGYTPATKKYLYRTITSASGVATYFRIGEVPIGTTTYVDDTSEMTDSKLAGNLQLESTTWATPPENLQGLIAMPNGFFIGWVGKDIYLSEAYHPHAWPAEYVVSTEYPIVGLGVVGQTCVICTQGFPSTMSGTKPGATSLAKSTTNEPCLSRGSIVSTPNGVIYASQNGLVMAAAGQFANITEKLITRDDWMRNYLPQTIRAVRHQNGYLALRAIGTLSQRSAFYVDPTALQVALTELSIFENCYNVFPDIWSGEVLFLQQDGVANNIKRWDPPVMETLPVRWKSKEFQIPKMQNFGCYSIYWDDARFWPNNYETDLASGGIPSNQRVRFKVWADRRVVYDQEVPSFRNGKPVRLPSGFKADVWQFEVRARAPVYTIHVASTEKELVGA